ncbi:MAG: ferrochelatase [Candidatus Marinimicrobia bacterium]|nr:ferrochelatase [Candidatus Neomarinimicrobiota bacterium]
MKTAVILVNMGAPSNLDEVKPFLKQLFSDPDIFHFPFGKRGQSFFSSMIATLRAPISKTFYQAIGGGSPLSENTIAQADALQGRLNDVAELKVFTAQRYWHPFISEVAEELRAGDYESIIILPLFPQYSTTTTLSIFNEWKQHNHNLPEAHFIERFYAEAAYNQACAQQIENAIKEFDKPPHILFSAHSIPQSRVTAGDSYIDEIYENMALIMEQLPDNMNHSIAFQSKIGPVKWVGPPLKKELKRLIKAGVDQVLVYPISFVSEHVETLFELDIEYAEIAQKLGYKRFVRAATVQTTEKFIDVLENLVREKL